MCQNIKTWYLLQKDFFFWFFFIKNIKGWPREGSLVVNAIVVRTAHEGQNTAISGYAKAIIF